MKKKNIKMDKISLGVCYYPEHWPIDMIDDDMNRIKSCGIKIIRVAEFAWSYFEPNEGEFRYDFFDMVLDKAKAHGLDVIFCTPTATPPAWLTHKYPEVLNAKVDGTKFRHGMRHQYNYNSTVYRELSKRIAEKIAIHYGNHPAIIGWQVDNEFNCEIAVFYSDADRTAFRDYLKNKYKTLEALNDAWGTTFWNQRYTDWEQVSLQRPTINGTTNPHQLLDEKRFFSYSTIEYCRLQTDILRKYSPNRFVMTNGIFPHLDYHKMTNEHLDFITYDSYPNFGYKIGISPESGELPFKDRWWSLTLSKVRSISPLFGIMEQQAGPGGWVGHSMIPSPNPGQLRLWTFQSIAHGADLVAYFRWRTCSYGTEMYWHGINDYHNQPNRRIKEVTETFEDIEKIADVTGKEYRASVGILRDYDNTWDGEEDKWYGPFINESESIWFKALQMKHIPMDIVQLEYADDEALKKYDALIYPHPAILTEERIEKIECYVEAGGKIIFGCRTGYKDVQGRCLMTKMPGLAAKLCGVNVKDFTFVRDEVDNPTICYKDKSVPSTTFNDILQAEGAEVIASYKGAYYDGEAAVTKQIFGEGEAYYHGAVFNVESVNALIDDMKLTSPITDTVTLPPSVELAIRGQYAFILNYSSEKQMILVKDKKQDLITGKLISGEYAIKAYDILVLAI